MVAVVVEMETDPCSELHSYNSWTLPLQRVVLVVPAAFPITQVSPTLTIYGFVPLDSRLARGQATETGHEGGAWLWVNLSSRNPQLPLC